MCKQLVVLYGKVNEHTKCVSLLRKAFQTNAQITLLDCVNREVNFMEIREYKADKVLFVSSSLYGPIKDISAMLEEFELHCEDVVGLINQPAYSEGAENEFNESISVECFQFSSHMLRNEAVENIFRLILQQAENRNSRSSTPCVLSELREQGYTVGGVINKDNFADFSIDAGYDYVKNKTYELLKETVCPFIFKRRFESDNNLNDDLNRAIQYVKQNSDYDIELMLEDVARTVNPLDSKRNLNLNYIIPSQLSLCEVFDESIYLDTAVFAHIYYEDRVENCLEYLRHVPGQIQKYLTTSNPNTYEVLKRFVDEADDTWHLQIVRNHGRDISALWVVDAPILKKYKYVCYVHDKKTSGQKGNILNGDYYHYNVWENCLKNETYIKNVLYILSTRDKLGFLSPPFPIFFDYKGLLGNEWTICYRPTVELAANLGISANISENKPPFAFSNTFWAKTDALLPMIDRQLQYEDFPGEPLPNDGSISHAIERIYIYCAQSQGYFSGIMEHDRYASMELNSMQRVMANQNRKLDEMRGDRDFQWLRAEHLRRERDAYLNVYDSVSEKISDVRRLGMALNPRGRVLIYGCGKIGCDVLTRMQSRGYKVDRFLVSDDQELPPMVQGIPCSYFSDISISENDVLIVALNPVNYEQVKERLFFVHNKVMYSELNI